MPFDKKAYDMGYARAHITRKFIPFNDTVPEDDELLAWLAKQENVTQYVKQLIREDMEGKRRERPLQYLVEEIVEVDERGEAHYFPKFCPVCRDCFGLYYPPNVCPNCGQRIDTEHGKSIGTRTVNKRENI